MLNEFHVMMSVSLVIQKVSMFLRLIVLSCIVLCVECKYNVILSHNGPGAVGSTINLTATVYLDGIQPDKIFKFKWRDNAIPEHSQTFPNYHSVSTWSVTYNHPGKYEVEVDVSVSFGIDYWEVDSKRTTVDITPLLNGEIVLGQNGTTLSTKYVSSKEELIQRVVLTAPDSAYVNSSDKQVTSYWYIDYAYVGFLKGLVFPYNYTNYRNKDLNIKAFVIVSPVSNSTTNETDVISGKVKQQNGTKSEAIPPADFLTNSSCQPFDPSRMYGCFNKDISIRDEVNDVKVTGNTWLQHGELLNLNVNCSGSPPFWHCVKIKPGEYNMTGQETCIKATQTATCSINIGHYLSNPSKYTVLFIIGNNVSKVITPVRVIIYEVQKHAQLSVIVVPVTCSVMAVIIIIFGVAYYLQSRSRYTIEVADFDFAQPSSDTEYKTLRERLRDAISGALNRTQEYVEDNGGGVWSPSRKYGSMQ